MKTQLTLEVETISGPGAPVVLSVRSTVKDADGRNWVGKATATGGSVRDAADQLARDPVFAQSMAAVVRHRVEAANAAPETYCGKSLASLKRMKADTLRALANEHGVDISDLGDQAGALALRTAIINHCAEGE